MLPNFRAMIPHAAGAAWVIFVAWLFGRKERQRVGVVDPEALGEIHAVTVDETESGQKRHPATEAALDQRAAHCCANDRWGVAALCAFMIACALALTINYPTLKQQGIALSTTRATCSPLSRSSLQPAFSPAFYPARKWLMRWPTAS
jgi:CitMHS family citrate-Mg2+:H+ or citrate-Ca2+:H+ symporter